MNLTTTLLTTCIEKFNRAKASLLDAAASLYEVREQEAWKGKYESFGEFVENGCGINRTQGSRLLTVYQHYVIQGGVDVSKLNPINPEKLYLARSAGGTIQDQIAKAQTLNVAELRAEVKDEDGHECEAIIICKHCGRRME